MARVKRRTAKRHHKMTKHIASIRKEKRAAKRRSKR